MDVVVPIVFPDYLIHVETPEVSFEVPDLLPGIDILPDKVRIPKQSAKVPELGHAGVLFINGKTGVTKYYEYGRYDPKALGIVRRVSIPDVTMKNGKPTRESLKKVVARISVSSGQNGAVSAAYIELPEGSFKKMLDHAERRLRDNGNPNRTPYALLSNSCLHFMKEVAEAGGASMPPGVVPIPKDYMLLVRMVHPKLDYARGIMTVPLLDGGVMQKAGGVTQKAAGAR